MNIFIETINWWYTIVVWRFFSNKVLDNFIFSMNKTRALPFAKNFSTPLYRDNSEFGKALSKIIKFWWIGAGTLVSLVQIIPACALTVLLIILPVLPVIGLVKFILKI